MKSATDLFRESDNAARPDLRMWLFVREDLPMPLGKFAAQAGHGYSTCLWFSNQHDPNLVATYMESAQGKIAVSVKDEEELLKCVDACKDAGLVAVYIKDAAHTVFETPTYTVGAVGPCYRKDLPKQVSRLRLFEGWQSSTVNDR